VERKIIKWTTSSGRLTTAQRFHIDDDSMSAFFDDNIEGTGAYPADNSWKNGSVCKGVKKQKRLFLSRIYGLI